MNNFGKYFRSSTNRTDGYEPSDGSLILSGSTKSRNLKQMPVGFPTQNKSRSMAKANPQGKSQVATKVLI